MPAAQLGPPLPTHLGVNGPGAGDLRIVQENAPGRKLVRPPLELGLPAEVSETGGPLYAFVNDRRFRFSMTHSYTFVRSGVSTEPGQAQAGFVPR